MRARRVPAGLQTNVVPGAPAFVTLKTAALYMRKASFVPRAIYFAFNSLLLVHLVLLSMIDSGSSTWLLDRQPYQKTSKECQRCSRDTPRVCIVDPDPRSRIDMLELRSLWVHANRLIGMTNTKVTMADPGTRFQKFKLNFHHKFPVWIREI